MIPVYKNGLTKFKKQEMQINRISKEQPQNYNNYYQLASQSMQQQYQQSLPIQQYQIPSTQQYQVPARRLVQQN
ncbi:hypothetical protein G9A89_016607 [Geosiphon pyriformis]|nr:hypothetical protein G9A89_016607 [Geosiphon pyriformis]